MIKAIFFDFDGVLTLDKNAVYTTVKYLSKTTGIREQRLEEVYRQFNHDLELGKISHKEIWDDFCEQVGKKISLDDLINAFLSTPMDKEMFGFVSQLKKYKLGIITDNFKDRFYILSQKYNLKSQFNSIILSSEVGSMKNDRKTFELALSSLEVKPEEAVFIDNTKANLVAPRELGMKTIYFDDGKRDYETLRKELLGLGVNV